MLEHNNNAECECPNCQSYRIYEYAANEEPDAAIRMYLLARVLGFAAAQLPVSEQDVHDMLSRSISDARDGVHRTAAMHVNSDKGVH